MHIIIYSHSPFSPSGYGQQTRQLAEQLINSGFEVSIVAIDYHASPQQIGPIKLLPTRLKLHESYHDLYYWAWKLKADKVIQLFDAHAIAKTWIKEDDIPVLTMNPVDCQGMPRNFIKSCKNSYLHIAMSPFAQRAFEKHHLFPNTYIPHCVDTEFYTPPPEGNNGAKSNLGLPINSFIFGMIATNLTIRKNIAGQLQAFRNFLDITEAQDCFFYLHTLASEVIGSAYGIKHLVESLGLQDYVRIPEQQRYLLHDFSQEDMKKIYQSFDVLMSCSMGEGFGVPIIEAQATGCPVITTDFSAMPHTCGNGGIKIKNYTLLCDSGHMGWWANPDIKEITKAMIELYQKDSIEFDKLSGKALENAKTYDWKLWIPKWIKLLKE